MTNSFSRRGLRFKLIALNLSMLVPLMACVQFYLLPMFNQRLTEGRKDMLRAADETVVTMIEQIFVAGKAENLKTEQIEARAKDVLNKLRYNGTDYFWVHNLNNQMVNHPMVPALNNTDLSGKKDPDGKALFAEMTELVKKDGAGFYAYLWPKPGSEKPEPKISFVKLAPAAGWVVGTGVYVNDIRAEMRTLTIMVWSVFAAILLLGGAFWFLLLRYLARELGGVSTSLAAKSSDFENIGEQLRAQSQGLAERSTEGAAALQQTSASLEEINSMIAKSVGSVQNLENLSHQFETGVKNGQAGVSQVVQSMSEIDKLNQVFSEQMRQSQTELQQMREMINQISEKTTVINEIVFQTKLLSFNASVEAARAGEAGKGFSVVAEEISNLAKMSGKSAGEIHAIVTESTKKASEIAANTDARVAHLALELKKIVERCLSTSRSSEKGFEGIVSETSKMMGLVHEIHLAIDEQSKGVAEITRAMSSLDTVTNENAAVSREVADAAGGLQGEVRSLQDNVLRLRTVVEGRKAA